MQDIVGVFDFNKAAPFPISDYSMGVGDEQKCQKGEDRSKTSRHAYIPYLYKNRESGKPDFVDCN